MYFVLKPEVAGELGEASIVDTSHWPPIVENLEYHFQGWLGDVLLASFPCLSLPKKSVFSSGRLS